MYLTKLWRDYRFFARCCFLHPMFVGTADGPRCPETLRPCREDVRTVGNAPHRIRARWHTAATGA